MGATRNNFDEDFSDTDFDDGFTKDMEALKRACLITGRNTGNKPQLSCTGSAGASADASDSATSEDESSGGEADDLNLLRSIKNRFAVSTDIEALTLKPLCTLSRDLSDSEDCEDDFETLRAIQRRFAAYSDEGLSSTQLTGMVGGKSPLEHKTSCSVGEDLKDLLNSGVQVGPTIIDTEKETSDRLFVERTNAREGFVNCVDKSEHILPKSDTYDDACGAPSTDLIEWTGSGGDHVNELPLKSSDFPKSALAFVDAIKKNRSCQKLIRSKMLQMEARIEEVKKLIERVQILKDFEVSCKKRTGRALSQKKDARVQLISVMKSRSNAKFNEKSVLAMYKGPPENAHVVNYRDALAAFPVSVRRKKWSNEERENLLKGIKQQIQGMLLQQSVYLLSEADGSGDAHDVDNIIVSIKDLEITPEKIRLFLPKVNWEQLAAMYLPGRSGAECLARFMNFDDPLVNHSKWTDLEDKKLLHIVQQRGLSNWIDIAASLGTNRTPFRCLARYQRSLNASIIKKDWTAEDDEELRSAVESFGESNWQDVAYRVEGRTGTQCSNRWLKTLHPDRQRVGKWTAEEDRNLKVAVRLFGPKTWKKVARCVPGRTQVQCRERWVNCLDPSLSRAQWTEEEDLKLEAAFAEHGYCWSKVAACIPFRTDNQCWRRWKALFPNLLCQHQADRKIQKTALISNFVDREDERPALGPRDFVPPELRCITASKNIDSSARNLQKRKRRGRKGLALMNKDCLSEISSEEIPRLGNSNENENANGRPITRKRRRRASHPVKGNFGNLASGDDESISQLQKEASQSHPQSIHVEPFEHTATLASILPRDKGCDVESRSQLQENASKLHLGKRKSSPVEDDCTLASFLEGYKLSRGRKEKLLEGKKRHLLESGERKSRGLVDMDRSGTGKAGDEASCGVMVEVEDGSKSKKDELQVQYDDDTNLGDLYRKLKRRS